MKPREAIVAIGDLRVEAETGQLTEQRSSGSSASPHTGCVVALLAPHVDRVVPSDAGIAGDAQQHAGHERHDPGLETERRRIGCQRIEVLRPADPTPRRALVEPTHFAHSLGWAHRVAFRPALACRPSPRCWVKGQSSSRVCACCRPN